MSSAGCPGSLRGCPCPSRIRNKPDRGTRLRVPVLLERGALPAGRAPAQASFFDPAAAAAASHALLTSQAGQDHAGQYAVLRAWDAALAAAGYDGPPVWLHGDLHPANILVNDGQVSGMIDFGDITAGDPVGDLAVAWMLLPPGCHASFWSAYQAAGGRAGDALRARARGWALNFAIVFLAHSEDDPVLREVGRRTLSAVLEDQRGAAG